MRRVAVVFTGGTIAMRPAADGGNVPALSGSDLLAAVPGLEAIALVEPIDWGLVPASHLRFDEVLEIGRLLSDTLGRADVDGALVVQGTDVIEETAFAWDLLPLPDKPIVVVGAMRAASHAEPDGPDNLRRAVAAAADPELAGCGVVVAMAGELHGADDVRKAHTHSLTAFASPNHGPIGALEESRVRLVRRREPARLPRIPHRAAGPVPLVTVALDDVDAIDAAVGRRPAALVVAAAGGGNTPPAYLDAARALMADGIPVAFTTRCPSGQARPGYGFPGGSSRWWEAGALFTGTLDGLKSRVLLSLGLGCGLSIAELGDLWRAHGGGRRDPSAPDG